jgi:SAM-dependent methyltransferase
MAKPKHVSAIDPSPGFIAAALQRLGHAADFRIGDARSLPFEADAFDIVVSGLMLNFVPEPEVALGEMRRVARADGLVAVYVWDYAEGMEMIRRFWDAALAIDPTIGHLDEAERFPLCRPERMLELFEDSGLSDCEATALEIPTRFGGFDEYWRPLEGGQGPAPSYVGSLPHSDRDRLRGWLKQELTTSSDGSIDLRARAWAVRGVV